MRPGWSVALGLLEEIGERVRREPAVRDNIPEVLQRLWDPARPAGRPVTEEEKGVIGVLPLKEFRRTHDSMATGVGKFGLSFVPEEAMIVTHSA